MPGTGWRFAADCCYCSHCVVLIIFIVVAEPDFSSLSPSFPLCLGVRAKTAVALLIFP